MRGKVVLDLGGACAGFPGRALSIACLFDVGFDVYFLTYYCT